MRDDSIAEVASELDQVVVLGAGFDTRAYRLECLADLSVFEVDHPDTQHKKRDQLRRHCATDDRVRFVATDFRLGKLGASLIEAGFKPSMPTLFVWEGVTNFLDQATVDATLRWCASAASDSLLIFTYIDRQILVDPNMYVGAGRALAKVRRAGEHVTFGMEPEHLGDYLHDLGLTLEDDIGASAYRARYYGPTAKTMQGHEYYRVARARIPRG